ncbi:MAG TPA: iron-sulfur cluster assembly accessory protein [Myxococcales bacterium]|nr:iron-sulfur cluster assembly accessory protein [Myxococcales bacterium]
MITITSSAAEHMRHLIAEQNDDEIKGIRISVMAGGCSGFSYQLDFEDEPELDDNVFGQTPRVYVDDVSLGYIQGLTLDFKGGLNGTGLLFNNPKATSTCGCGSSFDIDK